MSANTILTTYSKKLFYFKKKNHSFDGNINNCVNNTQENSI
jgi:hypothetical protein